MLELTAKAEPFSLSPKTKAKPKEAAGFQHRRCERLLNQLQPKITTFTSTELGDVYSDSDVENFDALQEAKDRVVRKEKLERQICAFS